MENQEIQIANKNVYSGLRPHQYSAFKAAKAHRYGIISDTCGSGKTRVECELICDALLANKKIIVLAAHRLDLINQHLKNLDEYVQDYHSTLLDTKNKDWFMFEVSSANRKEHQMQNYTNRQDIQNTLKGYLDQNKQVVITLCYQSLANLYAAIEGTDIRIDLMICDEGHIGMSAKMGKNEAQQLCEKSNVKIVKYDMVKFCDSFLIFTATPFKETMVKVVDGKKIEVIHDYSYAEANRDGIVLPFTANFYSARDFNEKTQLGMIKEAFSDLKEKFSKTSAKLLVCGTGLESNQLNFNTLIKQYKKEIESGTLAIAKIGSETTTVDEEIIPSCEWVDTEQLIHVDQYGLDTYKLNFKNDYINKNMVFDRMNAWMKDVDRNGKYRDIIIIHCQMLGVGVDLPDVNGVCILGNKESADLYQSIMRGCRIAHVDRERPINQRLEDHFEVYFHTDSHDLEPIKKFVNKLVDLGGLSMLEALTLNTPTYGHKPEPGKSSAGQTYLTKTIDSLKVYKACDKIVFDCTDFQDGIKQFEKLYEQYPDERPYIEEQYSKFFHKWA